MDAKPSPELISAVEDIPGVAAVSRELALIVTGPEGFYGVTGEDEPTLPFPLIAGTANHRRFRAGEILIGPGIARRQGIRPGDTIRMPGRDGFADVKVQGIWKNGDFTGFEATMPTPLIERLWGPQPAHTLNVRLEPGASLTRVASAIESAGLDPHLQARTPAEHTADNAREAALFVAPFWALQRGLLVVAFAAVLFHLLLVGLQRRREMGLVAAVGMSPRGLGAMILAEAAAVAVAGTLLGTVGALGMIEGFRQTSFLFIPNDMPLRIDPVAPFIYGALTTLVVIVAAALPAWNASRLQVVEAIRYE
jgi:putative ABC transport system permease protein